MNCPACGLEFDPDRRLSCPRCGEQLDCGSVSCGDCDGCASIFEQLRRRLE